jgi:4-diphosphocytidyl-2-C-methyl-D-erythritol kinase
MLAFSVLERGRRLTVRARAKVNLGLEVLSRRADGYHALSTLLTAVDLADRVTIEITGRDRDAAPISLSCDTPGVPPGPDNLAWRAADAMRREAGDAPPVRIHLAKAIPVAAGLGGGSADAAAVVAGLDRLWGVRLTSARRQALATGLGMDVPFFLGSGAALGTGRGERLAPAPTLAPLPLVLVNPGFPLATRDVYGQLRAGDFTDGRAVRALAAALAEPPRAVAARLVNGLEAGAARLWPGLAAVKAALLDAGALGAVMSGSGPTVVGVAASHAAARRIAAALASHPWRVWVTRTAPGPALTVTGGGAVRGSRGLAWGVAKR